VKKDAKISFITLKEINAPSRGFPLINHQCGMISILTLHCVRFLTHFFLRSIRFSTSSERSARFSWATLSPRRTLTLRWLNNFSITIEEPDGKGQGLVIAFIADVLQ